MTISVSWNYERWLWRSLECNVSQKHDLVKTVYVDFSSYDGVDMRVCLKMFKDRLRVVGGPDQQPSNTATGSHELATANQLLNFKKPDIASGAQKNITDRQ